MGDYARRSTDSFWNLAAQLHRGKDFAASVFRNSLAKGKRSDRGLTRLAFERLEERRMLTTYYVDNAVGQNGADSNAGTSLSAPFLTIQKAASIAEPGDVVDILAGTYRETVVPAHSGTATAPITYQPYNGQKVVIDGTNLVSGWTQYSGNIYETSAMNWTMGGQAGRFPSDLGLGWRQHDGPRQLQWLRCQHDLRSEFDPACGLLEWRYDPRRVGTDVGL
jgi:hypothetical protein